MNRTSPRLALLLVLLLSMLGILQVGQGTPANLVLAQAIECGPWVPFEEADAEPEAMSTPTDNDAFEIINSFITTEQSNSNLDAPKSLTELILFDDGELSILSEQSSIIRVDAGFVELTVCGDSQVAYQLDGEREIELVGEGTYEIPANSAIFIDPEDAYYITSHSERVEPAANVQLLDFEVASNELPSTLQPRSGSQLSVVSGSQLRYRGLCGGGGC